MLVAGVRDEEIQIEIVVVVPPARAVGVAAVIDMRAGDDAYECTVALILIEGVVSVILIGIEHIHVAIVVIIRPRADT